MSNLFQRSVQEKFLIEQNKSLLKKQYELFTAHFHDPEIQNNIKAMKEEQYQEGFLDDLFVKILGYTRNPKPDYNIT
ncbi:MAG: hypothetical protein L6407_10060, partial [Candidatus Delongbacteria bacterium]|nr:hypothetical protein [Candidatus Delongbacteria bacterium]